MKLSLSKTLTKLVALLVILTLMPTGLGLATSGPRPEVAVPFEDELTTSENTQVTFLMNTAMALPSGSLFQNGGDRLTDLQNNDGGWDWPLDDGDPASASPTNTVGPISRGLSEAYVFTSDPDHLAALQDAGAFLLAKTNNFSPSDGYLAITLDNIFGGTTYIDHVVNNFYGPLAAGTYDRNGAGTTYDTAGYVNLIRTNRSGLIANLAAWDIGIGLVGAASVGADTTAWIAGVKAEIDELDGAGYYDVIGLAGAIYGLAYVGENHAPLGGEHAADSSLADLGISLAGYQLASGGFTWNSGYPGAGNESIQETAYAILALNELNRATHLSAVQSAADYLESTQLGTGGWENYPGYGENNEVTGEALWGIAAAYSLNHPPVAEANGPYLVAVDQSVALDSSGSSDPDGDILSETWVETGTPTLGIIAGSTFTAGAEAGITEVTLTVDDGNDGTASSTAMLVVYDPSGGFVTGGGWIESQGGSTAPIFNSIPEIMPGSFPSLGYEATSTDEAGDHIAFTGTDRALQSVKVGLTNWSCENDFDLVGGIWVLNRSGTDVCVTTPGTGFNHPITLNIYEVDNSGPTPAVGALIASKTEIFFIPFRPSWDSAMCSDPSTDVPFGGTWYDPVLGTCVHGYAFNIDFDFSADGITLPDEAIYGVAYNTAHHGNTPLSVNGPYNSLNLSLTTDAPTIGTDVETETTFWDTSQGSFYCDGGTGGADTFRRDADCWGSYIPAVQFDAQIEGAYKADSSLAGKATFGFVSKYKKGADVPTGNTEFQFKAGDLNFHSTSYEWLVVTGSNFAKFKGEGTINGQGNYKFQIWAGDNSPDTFRIKIWDAITGDVVYDNGMNQAIGGGNIVVHNKK